MVSAPQRSRTARGLLGLALAGLLLSACGPGSSSGGGGTPASSGGGGTTGGLTGTGATPTTAAPSTTTAPTAPPTTAPAPTTTSTTPAAPPSSGGPGMVGGAGFAEGFTILGDSDAELAQRLNGIASTGATWLRVDVPWTDVEQVRGQYNWSASDRVITAARTRGLNILAVLAFTPSWARPAGTTDKWGPTDPTAYAAFARAAVVHYGANVRTWEIWNEPNMRMFWQPSPNPAAFTNLLKAAYAQIKSADPGATVVTGGTSPASDAADGSSVAPVSFLQGIYAAGGGGSFDAFGHHPSNYPYMPMRPEPTNYNYNAFGGVTPVLHDVMVSHGDGAKRIWATEMGAPVSYTVQGITMTGDYLAAYLTEAYQAWRQWSWTGPLLWYSYRDAGTNMSDSEDLFGMVNHSFTPKGPAVTAYKDAID